MRKSVFYILVIIALSIRFFHFGEELESPHVWRQSDTANYIWDFYKNGIDLFHPSVCWMGNYKTVILEFPLIEAIVSIGYHIFGPYQFVAKIVFFLFFLLSSFYLYKLIKYLYHSHLAQIATLVYLLTPLSLFYSRAIHIDFAELSFVFAMAYYYIKGIKEEKKSALLLGTLFAALAFVTKIPYVLPIIPPLVAFVFIHKKFSYVLRNFYYFLIPVGLFALWQQHVFTVNDQAPDWYFIPGYRKFTHNAGWYYGSFDQRLSIENWTLLKDRFLHEILGCFGLLLLILSFFFLRKRNYFILLWLAGSIVYLLIFFNLNRVHNYYQIPFIPILSVILGIGVFRMCRVFFRKYFTVAASLSILILGTESVIYSEKNYYQVPQIFLEVGNFINNHTENEDLVIVNYEYIDSKCPNFLYAAKRNGWQLSNYKLTGELIYRLMLEKARYFVSVRREPPTVELQGFFNEFPHEKMKATNGYDVYLYDLDFNHLIKKMPEKEINKLKKLGLLNEV